MNIQDEKHSISSFINAFAEALNSGSVKSIASHYTPDGVFFPDHYPSMNRKEINSRPGHFFKDKTFNIQFHIKDIEVHGDFAFVESGATAITTNLNGGNAITKVTRDLFTLRNENGLWKIYRYVFNNAN